MTSQSLAPDPIRWLLLMHQLPAQPAYLRVKIWRRLQAIGAIPLKSSAYVLPATDEALEDFQWLAREIVAGGGEAAMCEARLIDGQSDAETQALFNAQRDAAYAEIAAEANALDTQPPAVIARLKRRLAQVEAIDFFTATGRDAATRAIARHEIKPASGGKRGDLTHKLWVTRAGVFVDRVACAWVVRRFVDPHARFKFVADRSYPARDGEIRFDMFEAEIGHEGDRCSMETLIAAAGLGGDTALTAIAEIVHDIDLKDDKFSREETAGIRHLLTGVCAPGRSDDQRIARASAVFNDLYDYFGSTGR